MRKGILGRKVGMTGVFTVDGKLIPVTVVSVEPNVVTQVKTKSTDGYDAIQIGFETKKEKVSNKPEMGHAKKANATPKRFLKEIRGADVANYQVGNEINIDIFTEGEMVDVTGTSKGKGYQGVIKRYNQTRGPMSHGSQYHRGVGSLGTMRPMRVFKGKKLPGHMGAETVTVQNLEVIKVDLENGVILIKGNVPGPKHGLVFIKNAIKGTKSAPKKELVSYEEETVEETVVDNVSSEELINESTLEPENDDTTEEVVETNDQEESSQE